MKIEHTLVHYLLLKRVLKLQGLGTFYINDNIHIPSDTNTEVMLPPDSVRFEHDPKIKEDEELIDYIVKETKKIRPLVSADLDSYIMLGKQFLNIGKPFIIPGLGTLDKTQAVELQFIPGQYITPKITAPKALKANEDEVSSGLFQDHERKLPPNYDRRILGIIAISIVILGIGWAIYYFGFHHDSNKTVAVPVEASDTPVIKKDTPQTVVTKVYDTVTNKTPKNGFKLVVAEFPDKVSADKKLSRLTKLGYPVQLTNDDSTHYKIFIPFNQPLADTGKVKDSMKIYFRKKLTIQADQ